ncbi:MAG: phage tail tube protein [Alphaproteobacteria bacterium]|nr:phage tail tube protein [Alphaproteobacteria bacterium]
MVNPRQRLGVVEITVNGTPLDIVPGSATFDKGGKRRKTQNGDQGANFSVEFAPAKVEAEIFYGPGTRLANYENMDDLTVVVRCDTGQTYTMANAWEASDDRGIKAGDGGKHKLVFNADHKMVKEAGA